jgi:hypothetical protein
LHFQNNFLSIICFFVIPYITLHFIGFFSLLTHQLASHMFYGVYGAFRLTECTIVVSNIVHYHDYQHVKYMGCTLIINAQRTRKGQCSLLDVFGFIGCTFYGVCRTHWIDKAHRHFGAIMDVVLMLEMNSFFISLFYKMVFF